MEELVGDQHEERFCDALRNDDTVVAVASFHKILPDLTETDAV